MPTRERSKKRLLKNLKLCKQEEELLQTRKCLIFNINMLNKTRLKSVEKILKVSSCAIYCIETNPAMQVPEMVMTEDLSYHSFEDIMIIQRL